MPPLANLFPNLPMQISQVVIYVVAIIGAILISYGVFLEKEKKQDAVFVVGSACLIVYALWIGSLIFVIAMGGLFVTSLIEMVEIYLGYHKDIGEKNK